MISQSDPRRRSRGNPHRHCYPHHHCPAAGHSASAPPAARPWSSDRGLLAGCAAPCAANRWPRCYYGSLVPLRATTTLAILRSATPCPSARRRPSPIGASPLLPAPASAPLPPCTPARCRSRRRPRPLAVLRAVDSGRSRTRHSRRSRLVLVNKEAGHAGDGSEWWGYESDWLAGGC